jgi:hypothetical protein
MFHCLMLLALVYVAFLGLVVLWYLVCAVGNVLLLGSFLLYALLSPPAPSPLPPPPTLVQRRAMRRTELRTAAVSLAFVGLIALVAVLVRALSS